MTWFEERLYPDWRQRFRVKSVLFRRKTKFQDIVIFETEGFGRALALDHVVQVTEGDEFVYHEMLAHVTALAHGRVRDVLIVGGGDGGVLREMLKHPIERAVLVEIDASVVEMCRRHLPGISAGALDDPRTEIVIADGRDYVAATDRRFDIVIVDSTDPIGPGEVLFREEFYADCKRILRPGGILATQNGVPFMQPLELKSTHAKLARLFPDAGFFVAAVPTYVGGMMALGWASLDAGHRKLAAGEIARRFAARPFPARYWTPEIHAASFALPRYVLDLMQAA